MGDRKDKGGFFNIGRTELIEVEGLGEIQIGMMTGADELSAFETSESVEVSERAAVHVSELISRLIKSPSFTPSQVLELPNEHLNPIVDLVLQMNAASRFIDSDERDPTARLYSALIKQRKDSQEAMLRAFDQMQRPAQLASQALVHSLPDFMQIQSSLNSSVIKSMGHLADPFASHRLAVEAIFRNQKQYSQLARTLESIGSGFRADLAEQVFSTVDRADYFREHLESFSAQISMSKSFLETWSGVADVSAAFLSIKGLPKNLHSITASSLLGSSASWATELTMGSAILDSISAPEPLVDVITHRGMIMAGYYSPPVHSQNYDEPEVVLIEDEVSLAEAAEQERTVRRRRCQDILDTFERRLRSYVESKLFGLFGPKWWRQRVPGEVKDATNARKTTREIGSAEKHHPIHYTTIGELKIVITKSDNWEDAFEADFFNRTHLETMLEFVMTVRNDVDHGRHPNNDAYTRFGVGVDFVYEFVGYDERVSPQGTDL